MNSCSDSAPHYTPFTAVNASQYSSMKTVIISLSAAPQETLTIYTRPLWGNMLHLLSPFWGTVKTDVKVSENMAVALYCASSVISGWMRFITLSVAKQTYRVRAVPSLKHHSIWHCSTEVRPVYSDTASHQGDGEEKGGIMITSHLRSL